jgi:hypothetical protein
MSWESRNGTGRYYTRWQCHNGKIVRTYLGTGPLAEQAAAEDAARRAARKAQAEAVRTAAQRHWEAVTAYLELGRLTDLLMRQSLVQAGYYQHARSQWRKRGHVIPDLPTNLAEGIPGRAEDHLEEGADR